MFSRGRFDTALGQLSLSFVCIANAGDCCWACKVEVETGPVCTSLTWKQSQELDLVLNTPDWLITLIHWWTKVVKLSYLW